MYQDYKIHWETNIWTQTSLFFFPLFFLFVVDFVIHWNESAMGLQVFSIPIPPHTSLFNRSS